MKLIATLIGATALAASAAMASQAQRQVRPQPRVPAPLIQPSARTLLPATQGLLDGYVRDGKLPGIVGAFGFGDFPTQFIGAGRISDGASASAADPDSLWRIYSMTKPVTAMAAMILVEEGKLGLDEPIATYLPAFARMKVLTSPDTSLASRPATRPITIRHLLTHTAGLSYSISAKGPLLKEYERLGVLPLSVNASTEAQMRRVRPASLAEFADRVATLPLVAEPGTRWHYSIGLDVMGRVIEVASGMSFAAFVQTRLFDPLKMTSTYWSVPRAEVGRLATNYAFVGDNRTPLDPAATSVFLQPPSFPYGGAGLVSSARDYDRFLHMLQDGGMLDGARVMKPETARLAMSNLLPDGVTFNGIGGGTGGTQAPVQGYGAGGSVSLTDTPGGLGKGTYGWGGAAGTIAFVNPALRTRGTLMVNYFPAERWPLRRDVSATLARDVTRFRR